MLRSRLTSPDKTFYVFLSFLDLISYILNVSILNFLVYRALVLAIIRVKFRVKAGKLKSGCQIVPKVNTNPSL